MAEGLLAGAVCPAPAGWEGGGPPQAPGAYFIGALSWETSMIMRAAR